MSSRTKQIVADAAHTLGVRMGNTVLAALLGIITARALGPADRGIYVVPGVVASFMVAVCGGLSGATTYFLIKNKLSELPVVIWAAGLILSIAGGLLTAAIAFLSHQAWAAIPAMLAVLAASATSIATGFFYGISRVRDVNILAIIGSASSLLTIGASLYLIKRDPHVAIAAWIVSAIAVGLGANAYLALRRRVTLRSDISIASFLQFALKLGATSLVSLFNYRIDIYLVAFLTSIRGLGLYTVAVAAAESLLLVTQVAATVTLPHIGSMDRAESISLTARTSRNNLAIAVILCAGVFIVAPWFVGVLYGSPFLPAVPSLRVLLLGVLGLSTGSILSSYFTIHLGRPYIPMTIAAFSAVICLVVSFILIPKVGIVGGAIGTAVSYIITQFGVMLYFKKITGVPLAKLYFLQRDDIEAYRAWIVGTLRRLRKA